MYKKPNSFVYLLYRLICKTYGKVRLNIKKGVNEAKGIKDSYVLLCNHESSIDFFASASMIDRKAIFVVSDSYYKTICIRPLLDKCRVIPKQQFQTSTSSLKNMKHALDNNLPLVIYPTGLMTADGETTPLPDATGKAIKWLNKDVYIGCIKGSYLTNPKWGKVKRKGKITFEIKKLISKEDMTKYTTDQLQEMIEQALYFDAYKNQLENPIVYKNGDNLEGLEGVLYKCPKCGKEFTITSKNKNTLVCMECGNEAKANKYGLLEKVKEEDVIYNLPSDWSRYIKTNLEDEIKSNDNYSLHDECDIHIIVGNKYTKVGEGTISLNKDKITLQGKINDEDILKEYKTSSFITLPFVPNSRFEIQDGQISYRIYPKNKIETTKWINSIEILYRLNKN